MHENPEVIICWIIIWFMSMIIGGSGCTSGNTSMSIIAIILRDNWRSDGCRITIHFLQWLSVKDFHLRIFLHTIYSICISQSYYILYLFSNEIDILTQLQKKLSTRYTDLRFRDKKRTNSMTIPAASVVTHVPITVDKLNTGRIFSQRCLIWCW